LFSFFNFEEKFDPGKIFCSVSSFWNGSNSQPSVIYNVLVWIRRPMRYPIWRPIDVLVSPWWISLGITPQDQKWKSRILTLFYCFINLLMLTCNLPRRYFILAPRSFDKEKLIVYLPRYLYYENHSHYLSIDMCILCCFMQWCISILSHHGNTPLHKAAQNGHVYW
jgi:hypothetical protein